MFIGLQIIMVVAVIAGVICGLSYQQKLLHLARNPRESEIIKGLNKPRIPPFLTGEEKATMKILDLKAYHRFILFRTIGMAAAISFMVLSVIIAKQNHDRTIAGKQQTKQIKTK